MSQKKAKKIATLIIVPLMFSIFFLDILTVVLCNRYEKKYVFTDETFVSDSTKDRIHFLSTGNSDAIIIESNGKFAMIDGAEGSFNPRQGARINGYEKRIISYLKKVAGDSDGRVVLEFILGTHCHYDHVGCFAAVISDPDITVKKAYLKEIDYSSLKGYEVKAWGVGEFYKTVTDALEKRSVPQIKTIPSEPFMFGDFEMQFYNTVPFPAKRAYGENYNSIGTKLTKSGKSVFLAADITTTGGLEKKLAPLVGNVDILKLGHHGYSLASSAKWIRTLDPEIAVVTNELGKIYPNVKWNLTMISHTSTYSTVKENGIIIEIKDDGSFIFTRNIHSD